MVAKPELLLFLDEPSRCVRCRLQACTPDAHPFFRYSGLDSQTSWSILDLLEDLKNHGQASELRLNGRG